MGKTIWRELTVAYTFWLICLLILNLLMHGFVAAILPLAVLGWVWLANILAWMWTNRR